MAFWEHDDPYLIDLRLHLEVIPEEALGILLLGILVLVRPVTGVGIDVPFWGLVSHHLQISVGNFIPGI